jgi:hypothetical protein
MSAQVRAMCHVANGLIAVHLRKDARRRARRWAARAERAGAQESRGTTALNVSASALVNQSGAIAAVVITASVPRNQASVRRASGSSRRLAGVVGGVGVGKWSFTVRLLGDGGLRGRDSSVSQTDLHGYRPAGRFSVTREGE